MISEMFEKANSEPLEMIRDADDSEFRNIHEMNASREYDKMVTYFPLYTKAGSTVSYIITLMCFGILGACIRILINATANTISVEQSNICPILILGALMGLLTIVLSEVLPEFKFKSGNDKLFYSISLLAAIFTKEFFTWLEVKFNSLFKQDK